jgi:lipopolysaccharide export LptBFGC system permease protein LptF
MGIFHRYLIRRFLRNGATTLVVLTLVRMILSGGAPPSGFPAFLLTSFNEALPLSFLVGTLFTLGPMARNHETTALRAAGLSLARITWPILALGAVGAMAAALLDLAGFAPGQSAGPPGATPDPSRALLCLAAVLVGIAFGSGPRAASRFSGFLVALGVFLAYYVVTALLQTLGRHGAISSALGVWGPAILFLAVSLVLFRQAGK